VQTHQQNLMHYEQQSHLLNSQQDELVGGKTREWNNINQNKGQYVEHYKPVQNGAEKVKRTYEIKQNTDVERLNNPYLIHPEDYKTEQELFDAIKHWWIFKYRKKESTIKDRIRYAQKMSEHPIFPVNWLKFNHVQIINYLEHREYVDYENRRGKHQIINEWKTIKTFAKAFGINPDLWGYTPPSPPEAKVKQIPLPPTVHKLLHRRFSNNNYENALVSHILTHSFHIGWRPSELIIQSVNDVYLSEGYIIITETKKYNQPRQLWPDKTIMTSRQKKSLRNYIECWRPQVANEQSGNFLYLQKNGRPFISTQHLSAYLKEFVGDKLPGFHPYLWRHWCAISRLIRSKVETKRWDIWDVKEWMGHEKIDTTEAYVKFAKNYYRNAPYDWVRAVLKSYKTDDEFLEQPNDTTTQNKLAKKQRERTRLLLLEDSAPVGEVHILFSFFISVKTLICLLKNEIIMKKIARWMYFY